MAVGCRRLELLNLTWCVNVDDAAVGAVAEHCRHLRLLSVFGLRGVTDACLAALAANCASTLATIDVHGCCNVMASTFRVPLALTCFFR
jgi:F-box/leucine-rich repeat protein 2/20